MNIIRDDLGNLKILPRIPSRVILNNRTISIFESGSYDTILKSFYIKELISFKKWEDDQNCIKLQDHSKIAIMCVMCTTDKKDSEIKNWINDINEFRDKCQRHSIKPKGEDPRVARFKKELEISDIVNNMKKASYKDDELKKKEEIKTLKIAQLLAIKVIIEIYQLGLRERKTI